MDTFRDTFHSLSMQCINNAIEAHCYALQCTQIDCEKYVAESINNWTKAFVSCIQNELFFFVLFFFAYEFCTQLTKAFVAEMSRYQLLIDSAMYLLTINLSTMY